MDQNAVEYLKNFKSLLDEGLITQEEFNAKKVELLSTEGDNGTQEILSDSSSNIGLKRATDKDKRPERNLGSIIGNTFMLGAGIVAFCFGVGGSELRDITFQADYYTYQYKATVYVIQTLNKLIVTVGLVLLCFGLKGLLKEVLKGRSI